MNEIIGFCGTVCSECGAFIATKNNDDDKRAKVAKMWSKQYNSDIKPEDINCDGCQSEEGCVFNYCTVCEIRKCGKEKNVTNCAYCDEYACDKIEVIFQMSPDAKKKLDEIRSANQ
jgi:hypothetical protein